MAGTPRRPRHVSIDQAKLEGIQLDKCNQQTIPFLYKSGGLLGRQMHAVSPS